MHYIGIDWADQKHDVCILAEDGRVLSEFSIDHDWDGFERLQAVLERLGLLEINLERSDGLLVERLVSQGWPVYVTAPTVVAKRRPRRSKDDRGDAYLLASLRRSGDRDTRPVVVQSELVEELRQVTQAFEQIQRHQRRMSNQLAQVLKHYYPAAVGLFSQLHSPLSLAFLTAYPTPEAARAASRAELQAFFKRQHYRWMRRFEEIYQRLQQPAPPARVCTGYVSHVLALVAMLQTLHEQRHALERRMKELFDAHPEADWWRAFPGAGPLTAPRLLARIGDQRERFPSAKVLQAVAGTVPVTRRSGKKTIVEFRVACSKPLRNVVMDLARNSVRKSGWARSYFRDQLARGHPTHRAYRALARNWLRIIWKLWQTGELYDEARHVANRSRKGLPAPVHLAISSSELSAARIEVSGATRR
jgi:transposase